MYKRQVVVCDSGREPKREWDYIRLLSEMNADGIVITANNDEMEEEIRRCRLPVVVVDRKAGREYEASVSSDNYLGGQLAAEHLVDCGCKRLVHLRGPQLYSSGQMRFQGYMDCLLYTSLRRFDRYRQSKRSTPVGNFRRIPRAVRAAGPGGFSL